MKTTLKALPIALLLCLPLAGPLAAMPEEPDTGFTEETMSEEQEYEDIQGGDFEEMYSDDEPVATDDADPEPDAGDDQEWTGSDVDGPVTAVADEDLDPAPAQKVSDGKRLKQNLAQALLGVLMPAVEREVRQAVDLDEEPSDIDDGFDSDP